MFHHSFGVFIVLSLLLTSARAFAQNAPDHRFQQWDKNNDGALARDGEDAAPVISVEFIRKHFNEAGGGMR